MLANSLPLSVQYPPAGRLIAIADGPALHLEVQGTGPTVVLEAGLWDFSPTWALVQPEVARFAQAVVYDRAGLGWSQTSPRPRTAAVMAAELRAALHAAGVAGPFVLVGHSFGGLIVRLFAYTYPEEVAGLVLVDAAHEDQTERFPAAIQAALAPMQAGQVDYLGQLKAVVAAQGPEAVPPLMPIPPAFPPDLAARYRAVAVADPSRVDTMLAELQALETSQAQVRAARRRGLGRLPVRVLSHGLAQSVPGMSADVNREYEAVWQGLQAELAALSPRGEHRRVPGTGHLIHHDQPPAVVAAIRAVLAMV